MSQVWELDLPQPLKLLALALADWADDDGGNVHPSIPYAAWKVGATERTVQRQMKTLEMLGIVEVVALKGYRLPSGQWVKLLAVHPEKGQKLDDWQIARGDNLTPLEPERGDTRRVKGVTSEPERGDIAVSPNTLEATSDLRGDDFENPIPRLPGETPSNYLKRITSMTPSLDSH